MAPRPISQAPLVNAGRATGRPRSAPVAQGPSLDFSGLSAPVVQVLKNAGCPQSTLDRLKDARRDRPDLWDLLLAVSRHPGAVDAPNSLLGFLGLVQDDVSVSEVLAWARLGGLAAAYGLHGHGYRPEQVVVLTGGDPAPAAGLKHMVSMITKAATVGIVEEDLPMWIAGAVAFPHPPFVDDRLWARWRQVAVHSTGMRVAALAAAAGLMPEEARAMQDRGEISEESLRLLFQLRSLDRF